MQIFCQLLHANLTHILAEDDSELEVGDDHHLNAASSLAHIMMVADVFR
jgi:hypothetical protein